LIRAGVARIRPGGARIRAGEDWTLPLRPAFPGGVRASPSGSLVACGTAVAGRVRCGPPAKPRTARWPRGGPQSSLARRTIMAQRLRSKDDVAVWDPLSGLKGRVVRRFLVLDVGAPDGEVVLPSGARGRLVGSFHSPDLAFALAESERGQGRRALVYDLRQLRTQAAQQPNASSMPVAREAAAPSGQRPISTVSRKDEPVASRTQARSTARPRGPSGSKRR